MRRWWKGGFRRLTSGLGVVTVCAALLMWGASPAAAGGPTSVLLVSPPSGESAALTHTDKEYAELEKLLGPPERGVRDMPREAGVTALLINVTWMLHDVSPWRVDRVFPAEDGDVVWIHTEQRFTEEPTTGVWRRAARPGPLRALLKELGLMGPASEAGTNSAIYPVPWEAEAEAEAGRSGSDDGASGTESDGSAASAQAPPRAAAGGTGWWWAIPVAATGAVLALLLRPYVTRLPFPRRRPGGRGGEPGPRQELLDL
ncbi:hypothetical protein ACFTXK_18940 [Streptomyces sp. NPDC056956]|uniref:hypothetical protein n=1 Tax=Streptomyces sp. NPDC056956 TaxID=3345980 RepID=UPI00362CBA02